MARHDDLLGQGPHEAPEPETAEERSKKLRLKTAGGAVVAGGAVAAKLGVLGKILLWLFIWNGVSSAWRIGGWIAIALILAAVGAYFLVRRRREA